MHAVKITDEPLADGGHRFFCPYCKSYLRGNAGEPVKHNCPDAGFTVIINGYMFVGAANYISEEQHEKSN